MQNVRGGRIVLKPIDAPAKQGWDSAVEAVQDAIELEKMGIKLLNLEVKDKANVEINEHFKV